MTKQTAHVPGAVVVVGVEPACLRRVAADRAAAALRLQHRVVLLVGDAELFRAGRFAAGHPCLLSAAPPPAERAPKTASEPWAKLISQPIGVSSTATAIWDIAKWPVLAALFVTMISLLYYASPNVKLRGFKWVTPGSLVALIVWVLASAGFAFYVSNFGSYDKTYGTLAGIIVLLMWLWITNLAILFGHELNAERERSAEIGEGKARADRELQLEPRSDPKEQRTT